MKIKHATNMQLSIEDCCCYCLIAKVSQYFEHHENEKWLIVVVIYK